MYSMKVVIVLRVYFCLKSKEMHTVINGGKEEIPNRIFVPFFLWVIRFPPASWEYVLIPFVPTSHYNFTSMRLREEEITRDVYK